MHLAELFGRVGPILGFLVCITVVAELADQIGLFDVLAREAAELARGSVLALWLLVVLVGGLSSAVLSLDTTAVLITPVVLVLARQLGLSLALFAYTAVWLANTASLLLPVSNLTNLLAWDRLGEEVGRFAALMWPAAVAALLITVAVAAALFGKSLRGRYQNPPHVRIADRFLFWLAAGVCAALGPAFALGVNVVVAAGSGAALLVIGCLLRNRSFLTWRLLPWKLLLGVSVLFVAVQLAQEHGLSDALGHAAGSGDGWLDLLRLSAVAALSANLVDNLPAYLAIEPLADSPLRVAALLIGVDAGPLILPWGSLATLLWASRCRSAGVDVAWRSFAVRGLTLVPLLILGCVSATVLVH